jgi:hypothetical protein
LQVARTDFVRQIAPAGTDTWNYDNTKGFNGVPWYKLEFDALLPPYIQHNSKAEDGFGDVSLSLKYRLAAANEEGGNYSVSFSLAGTMPTGSFKNGSLASTISPPYARARASEGSTCNRRWEQSCPQTTRRNSAASWCGTR